MASSAAWAEFEVEDSVSVPFTRHAEPTDLYNDHISVHKDAGKAPFTDPAELFNSSHALVEPVLSARKNNQLVDAWAEELDGHLKLYTSALTNDSTALAPNTITVKLIVHALRLANAPPDIFGSNSFELNQAGGEAIFTFAPFTGDTVDATIAQERHDIALWLASFHHFGKLFVLEGWKSTVARSLVEDPDLNTAVMRITHGSESFTITREAYQAMVAAVDANANRPTVYFRQKYVITCVTKILGFDMNKYSMPQTQATLQEFDWNTIIPGRPETYPQGQKPTDGEFEKVKSVHEDVKEKKDSEAKRLGQPKSGVQSHITFKQRWKQYRDIHAIYRHMQPTATLQMVADTVAFRLKLCKSMDQQCETIKEDIIKHIAKLKRERKKKEQFDEVAKQIKESEAAEKNAREEAKRLEAERKKVSDELVNMGDEEAPTEGGRSTRRTRARLPTTATAATATSEEIEQKRADQARCLKEIEETTKTATEKRRETLELKKRSREIANRADPVPVKKLRKCDITRLQRDMTPRQKRDIDGADWAPPIRDEGIVKKPGSKWKQEASKKLTLLTAVRDLLKTTQLVGPPMAFPTLMDFIQPDDDAIDFDSKCFIFLVGLLLHQKSSFDDVIAILLQFVEEELTSPNSIVTNADAADLQRMIGDVDDKNLIGETIFRLATDLDKAPYNGVLPRDKKGLASLGCLDDTVAALLLKHVFGSTDLVVGLHARKILTALDMVDWEETGTSIKKDVKMVKLPPEKVKKSLRTWLPRGEAVGFHDTMDTVGSLLGAPSTGDWGRIKAAIATRFATKEKKQVLEMLEHISQFYKATKCGGKVKVSC